MLFATASSAALAFFTPSGVDTRGSAAQLKVDAVEEERKAPIMLVCAGVRARRAGNERQGLASVPNIS